MIFEQDTIVFQILDVLDFDQSDVKKYNFKRNFDALSLRYEADTIIEYKDKQLHFTDNSIGFFPSDVDYTRIANHDKMIVVHFKAFNYHTNKIESFFPVDYKKYRSLFEKMLDCWNKKDISYKHEAASLLNLIFSEFYKDNKKTYIHNSKIDSSIIYIEENYLKKDFSLQLAAEKSYISDTYFRKLFRQEFGISPKQYVINHRIKYAASLIIAGYYSLQEISELCGYSDYKHFSVEFKKIIGVSPSKYTYKFEE
ncbi:MAG: helix-turn-helix transcriptional regulator [Ruminococcaceae bacterium]|nr:helix-turn-helix transcriptional regulator [Oscillospiraceae bacterium]